MKQSHKELWLEGPLGLDVTRWTLHDVCWDWYPLRPACCFIHYPGFLVEFYPAILPRKGAPFPCWATLATLGSALEVATPQISRALNSSDLQNRDIKIPKPPFTPPCAFWGHTGNFWEGTALSCALSMLPRALLCPNS